MNYNIDIKRKKIDVLIFYFKRSSSFMIKQDHENPLKRKVSY